MFANEADPVGAYVISIAAGLGYDYVELPLAQIMDLTDYAFERLKQDVSMAGIACESCNNCFPAHVRLTGNERDEKTVNNYIDRAFSRAAELDAKIIVFGSSAAKNVPVGFPHIKAFEQLALTLRTASEAAQKYGVSIAIEALNRSEANITLNLSDAEKLMTAVSRPNVNILLDYYHFMLEADSAEVLRRLLGQGKIIHAHFAEPKDRAVPIGIRPEYAEIFTILRENGYDGRCSIEARQNPRIDLCFELKTGIEAMRELTV